MDYQLYYNEDTNIAYVLEEGATVPQDTVLLDEFTNDGSRAIYHDVRRILNQTDKHDASKHAKFADNITDMARIMFVLIKEDGSTQPILPTGVTVTPSTVELEVEATQQLEVTITPVDASYTDVDYESDDLTVATVSESGLVTGVSVGEATITVQTLFGNQSATITVTVSEA